MTIPTICLHIISNLQTVAYYGIILASAFAVFVLSFIIIFIHTPGDFKHPYYETNTESGSGFGGDHSINRTMGLGRRGMLPPSYFASLGYRRGRGMPPRRGGYRFPRARTRLIR